MHQLAKKFTSTGLPVLSASASGGSPSRSGESSGGAARPTITEPIDAGSRPDSSDQAKKPAMMTEHQQRQEEEERGGSMALLRPVCATARRARRLPRCAARRRARRRSVSETKPPSAHSAAPSQIQGASGL